MKEAIKSFARRFVAGRTLVRRLPASVGAARIVVSPESQLKYLKLGRAGFDPALITWAERHVTPGGRVWDIGANVGVFSFAAAGRGAHVLSVEADPYMASLLLRSKQLNPALSVDVLTAAVSDRVGLAALHIASGGRASNALAGFSGLHTPFGRVLTEVQVPTIPLDKLLHDFGSPDVVKIDIEGAEMLALAGADRLLREIRPVIIVEISGEVAADATALFARHGYALHDAETGSPTTMCAYNCLAIPTARGVSSAA